MSGDVLICFSSWPFSILCGRPFQKALLPQHEFGFRIALAAEFVYVKSCYAASQLEGEDVESSGH